MVARSRGAPCCRGGRPRFHILVKSLLADFSLTASCLREKLRRPTGSMERPAILARIVDWFIFEAVFGSGHVAGVAFVGAGSGGGFSNDLRLWLRIRLMFGMLRSWRGLR